MRKQKEDCKLLNHVNILRFKNFCKDNIWNIIIVEVFILLGYGMKLFHVTISHDTESIMSVSSNLYEAWYSMGRFGNILLKKMMGTYWFNPYVASFLMIVTISIASILWMYLFQYLSGSKKKNCFKFWVFPVLFFVSPIMADQFSFLLQAFEVAVAISLISVALILVFGAIINNEIWKYIPAIMILILCFGIYQAMLPLYMAGAAACFLILYDNISGQKSETKTSFYWLIIMKLVISFLISYVMYQVVSKVILGLFDMNTTPYIENQVLWGREPISVCLFNIKIHILDVLKGNGVIYNKLYVIICIISISWLILKLKRRTRGYYLYALAMVFLLLTPSFMTIILGQAATYRTELNLPFVAAFGVMYLYSKVENREFKYKKVVCFMLCIGIMATALHQGEVVARLYYTEYVKYQQDIAVATKISDRIEQLNLGEIPKEPVVFIGNRTQQFTMTTFKNEDLQLLGRSFFSVSFSAEHGTYVIRNFLKTLGYNYVQPTSAQILRAQKKAEDMGSWPNSDSVQMIDGIIIVKLSD